jgi:hypothetical protein
LPGRQRGLSWPLAYPQKCLDGRSELTLMAYAVVTCVTFPLFPVLVTQYRLTQPNRAESKSSSMAVALALATSTLRLPESLPAATARSAASR